jgi:hypothetical protein
MSHHADTWWNWTIPSQVAAELTLSQQLEEQLARDKLVASLHDIFGWEVDSDDEAADVILAAEAAVTAVVLSGTQFIFSPAQVTCSHEKVIQEYDSDGKSMLTARKTADSTCINSRKNMSRLRNYSWECAHDHLLPTFPM